MLVTLLERSSMAFSMLRLWLPRVVMVFDMVELLRVMLGFCSER